MLVSDPIAKAEKCHLFWNAKPKPIFFHFCIWIFICSISGADCTSWDPESGSFLPKSVLCMCVYVHSCTLAPVCVCIYTHMTPHRLLSSWEAELSGWPGTSHAWSLPTYWACLTYRPCVPSRDALDKQAWAHQSCLVSSPSQCSPLCTAACGHIGNHRVLHPDSWAHRLPGTREFAAVKSKGAIEWHAPWMLLWACPGGESVTKQGRPHSTEHKRCPRAHVSSAYVSSSHFILPTTLVTQRGSGTRSKSHSWWSRTKKRDSPAAKEVGELNPGAITVPRMWLWHVYTLSVIGVLRVISRNTCELEKEWGGHPVKAGPLWRRDEGTRGYQRKDPWWGGAPDYQGLEGNSNDLSLLA